MANGQFDHAQQALDFLAASDREFHAGDILQGSEKLWGAATHAVMAATERNGRKPGSHRGFIEAVEQLAEEHDKPSLVAEFAVAQMFHRNFYHAFMVEDYELNSNRPLVHQFVDSVLALRERWRLEPGMTEDG